MRQATNDLAGTAALAEHATGLKLESVPETVADRATMCFLDAVGLATAAQAEVGTLALLRLSMRQLAGDTGTCVVIGRHEQLPPQYAALVNGSAIHAMDFDDTNLPGSLHPGAAVVPGLLAAAGVQRAPGTEALAALIAGYEVMCRVGAALGTRTYDRGFHITAIAGVFGASAAIARLLGLTGPQLESIWGLAGSMAAGLQQYLEDGSDTKRLHPGLAAHHAWLALQFAQAGLRGPSQVLEGRWGVLQTHSDAPDSGWLDRDLGKTWLSESTAIKPWPACRFGHGAIAAVRALRAEWKGSYEDPDIHLTVRLAPRSATLVGEAVPRKLHPESIVDGQFSVYYQVAVTWLEGHFTWRSYDRLGDADLDDLSRRITVETDDTLSPVGAEVLIYRGTQEPTARLRCDPPPGEPSDPLPNDAITGKYRTLVEPVLGRRRADELAESVLGLASLDDMNELLTRLRPP